MLSTMRTTVLLVVFVVILMAPSKGVAWNTCGVTFCNRVRNSPDGINHRYYIDGEIKLENGTAVVATLKTDLPTTAVQLKMILKIYNDEIVHVLIDEIESSKRYRPDIALTIDNSTVSNLRIQNNRIIAEEIQVEIVKKPFAIKIFKGDHLFSEINPKDNFVFQTNPYKEIAMGVTLHDVNRAYGIPEHAEHLALASTKTVGEPYRHFNLDYGHYLLESREALYGSIGVLYGHGTKHSSGVFWLNAAQTWIDLENSPNDIDAFFMSESGVVEMFVLSGPTLPDAVKQYTRLTGTAPLPQYFTLGYHQSRYSYMTQNETLEVIEKLDEHDMPVDVVWLDIDYTDQKKYFTWDPQRFSDPKGLLDSLAKTKRKLVAIIDPHIKVEVDYPVHDELSSKKYYVKAPNGIQDFEGECWPGISSYIDFLNPEALNYYASLYSEHNFNNSNIYLWNDMNEPAVFNTVPANENTLPPTAKHYGDHEHKDVHNIYGFYQTVGTREGLLNIKPTLRPFILTRSHFAGIQRYAAIWTGDNAATWEYLQMSFPMCLTEALAGVSFCGADVGGFFEIPEDELYQRWYQAGAWLPFYRGHSTIDVPRREPYLFNDGVQHRVREALFQRYAHLPVWYTLFYEHEVTGEPVIRPITYHYPQESEALSIENQILLGKNILAAPVLKKGILITKVYLPGGNNESWFNIDDQYKKYSGNGYQLINVSLDSTPVFYRGGSIISRKDTKQRTTEDTHNDPFTLYISLDDENKAEGNLYVDDYQSFKYQTDQQFLYVKFNFTNSVLYAEHIVHTTYQTTANVSKLIFIHDNLNYNEATLYIEDEAGQGLGGSFSKENNGMVLSNFMVSLNKQFRIEFGIASSARTNLGIFWAVILIVSVIRNF